MHWKNLIPVGENGYLCKRRIDTTHIQYEVVSRKGRNCTTLSDHFHHYLHLLPSGQLMLPLSQSWFWVLLEFIKVLMSDLIQARNTYIIFLTLEKLLTARKKPKWKKKKIIIHWQLFWKKVFKNFIIKWLCFALE